MQYTMTLDDIIQDFNAIYKHSPIASPTPYHPNQRLEAARREIAERQLLVNDKKNRVIYYDDVFYTCSICGRGSANIGLILNHDCL